MEEKSNREHLKLATDFCDIVKSTLGPRGMNKIIVDEDTQNIILTNDGATIVGNIKGGNPIIEMFKNIAKSQELAVGDGTTTSLIITGELIKKAIELLDRGVHPTTIIEGYEIARRESIKFINSIKEEPDKLNLIKTSFGTKLPKQIIEILSKLVLKIKKPKDLKIYKMENYSSLEPELFKGYVFDGFTINERMKDEYEGRIAVLDFPINWKMDKFAVTKAEEMEKVQNLDSKFKQKIVDKLKKLNVGWIFYSDTTPEFEAYLTEQGITGVVVHRREDFDYICKSINAVASSNFDQINENNLGYGKVRYVKQRSGREGHIFIEGDTETLIIKGETKQILEEIERAVLDVISLLKLEDLSQVTGAGAVEIEIANHLRNFSKQVGGKVQIAIEKFADAIESIPITLAENCGLDAIEILTFLRTIHLENKEKDAGIDAIKGISNARERGIFEPAVIKIYAINSATNLASLLIKTDNILAGTFNKKEKEE